MRLIVLIVLVVVAVWLIRRAFGRAIGADEARPRKEVEGELVACARCGVNLPREEARSAEGGLFCSDEHARLGRR